MSVSLVLQVAFNRWRCTVKVRTCLVAVETGAHVPEQGAREVLSAHKGLKYLKLSLEVEGRELLLHFFESPLNRFLQAVHSTIVRLPLCVTIRPSTIATLYPVTNNIRRITIDEKLCLVNEKRRLNLRVYARLVVQEHVVTAALNRSKKMKQKSIGGTDALELDGMAAFVTTITDTLQSMAGSRNANEGAIKESNILLKHCILTCNSGRVCSRTLCHKRCSPSRDQVTPPPNQLVHAPTEYLTQRRCGATKQQL